MERRALGTLLRAVADLVDPGSPAPTPVHAPSLDGLPPVQKTIVETARALAAAEAKPDLVDWAEPKTAPVTPASWDDANGASDAKLRARLFSLLRDKLGLSGEGAAVEARHRCAVGSTAKATAEDLRRGIDSLAGLPGYVAPALPAGPVASYTAAAGIARGCSPELAEKLSTLAPEDKAPALSELTRVHSQPVIAAAKAKAGIPAGGRAKDVGEARAVVMRLPVLAAGTSATAADVPPPVAPTRAEVLARKLGGSPHAAAVAAELAAAEAGRTKGSAASGLCVSVCDLLKARLKPEAWDALSREHAGLWEGDHPTLGGVLALVDAAPLDPQAGA